MPRVHLFVAHSCCALQSQDFPGQRTGPSRQRIKIPFKIYDREGLLSYTDFVCLSWGSSRWMEFLAAEFFWLVVQQKPQNVTFLVSWGEEPPQPEIQQVEHWKDFLFSSLSLHKWLILILQAIDPMTIPSPTASTSFNNWFYKKSHCYLTYIHDTSVYELLKLLRSPIPTSPCSPSSFLADGPQHKAVN